MIPVPAIAALQAIPWRLLGALALVLGLAGTSYFMGRNHGSEAVQRDWDKERLTQAQDRADALERAIKVQQSLQAMIDQARRERENEKARIDRLYAAALDGLRDRPEGRAADGVPETPGAGEGCTGAGLARPDAGFLARYAADAARLQAALNECRAGYQAARQQLEAIGGVKDGQAP